MNPFSLSVIFPPQSPKGFLAGMNWYLTRENVAEGVLSVLSVHTNREEHSRSGIQLYCAIKTQLKALKAGAFLVLCCVFMA